MRAAEASERWGIAGKEKAVRQTLAPFMTTFSCAKKTVDGGEQKLLEEPGAADGAGRSDAAPSSPAEWQLAVAVAVSLLRCVGSWLHSGFIRVACLVNNSSS